MTQYLAIHTTVADAETAQMIARALVEHRLAACVHIDEVDSVYRWKDGVQREREWRLIAKTTDHRAAAVETAIRSLHPYDLPALYALTLERVDGAYAAWLEASVT